MSVSDAEKPGGNTILVVFVITRADDLGGAQVHVRDLAAALVEHGEEVILLAGGGGILFEQLAQKGITCRRLEKLIHPIRPWKDFSAYLELRTVLREIKPDLVATHSNKAGLLGRLAAHSLAIPVIHTSHGFLFSGRQMKAVGLFYRVMEKAAAKIGDKVIAVSKSEFKIAESLGVIDPGRMAVVYNGLPDCAEAFIARPGAEPVSLVMVARFAEPKDHLTLLKALGALRELNWSLKLVGDGSGRNEAERLAAQLGIAERVSFTGVRQDVEAILATSQIFVLSSKREGFPISILEAMRAGLPVVAADVGGVKEAVTDGETGYLYPAGDAGALREHLEQLIRNPELRLRMGQAGRKRFLKKFTLEQMVEKTLALYRDTLNRG